MQIYQQDVSRTQFKQNKEELTKKLHDILVCYQRRNPTIGYCQGMNYIVTFLLELDFTEEELFWILVQVLENIIPIDYFPNFMLGLLCDLKIFNDLLKFHNNKIWKKFQEVQIDTSIILTHWLVCLFTNSVQKQVLLVIWDHLFVYGSVALFKASLILLDICQEEILESTGGINKNLLIMLFYHYLNKHKERFIFYKMTKQVLQRLYSFILKKNKLTFLDLIININSYILHKIEQKIIKYDDSVTFNQKISQLYVSKKAITVLRDLYRQIFHLEIDKDQQKIRNRVRQFYIKRQNISCNLEWPICHHYLEREKLIQEKDFDHFILREKNFPPSIRSTYFNNTSNSKQVGDIQNNNDEQCIQVNKIKPFNFRNQSQREQKEDQHVIKKSGVADETNNISDFDISHLEFINKQNPNQTQLDLQIHEISQIANKHKSNQNPENELSPFITKKKKIVGDELKQLSDQKEKEILEKENFEKEQLEKKNKEEMILNYDFGSFLDEIDLKFQPDQQKQNDGNTSCKSDELFIMRTPHICHLQDKEVFQLQENKQEVNPLQKYIQSISEQNCNEYKNIPPPPQSVQFMKMFTPKEVFSDLVLRDVTSYEQEIDEL